MSTELGIVFLRHGRSRADDEEVHEGRYDSPLTEVGRAQVRARADEWRAGGRRFDAVVCSPLVRARETAEIVAATLDVAVECDADWIEADNGGLAGLPFDVAAALYPPPTFRGPFDRPGGTGESGWTLQARAARALASVIGRGSGRYLVVAHGGILNAALRCIVGAPPPANGGGVWFRFGDAGYAETFYDPSHDRWVIGELRT